MLNSCRTKLVAASKAPTTVSRTTLRETVSVEFSNVYLSSMSNVISRLPLLGWRVVHRAYHSNSLLGRSAMVAHRIGTPDTLLVLHPRYRHNSAGRFLGLCNRILNSCPMYSSEHAINSIV